MLALFLIWIVLCAQIDNTFGLDGVKTKSLRKHHEAVEKYLEEINYKKAVDVVEYDTNPCLTITLDCPQLEGIHPVYAALPNCTQFCQCSNGAPYLFDCPADLHFNPILNVCDYPYRAGCLGSTGDQICLDTNITCPQNDGVSPVYTPLENCSQFCQCSNGFPYVHECTEGLHFNPVLNECDYPYNAGCPGSTGDQECLDTDIDCPPEDGEFPEYGALPNCSQFCLCSKGHPYVQHCSEGHHFNPTLHFCDAPDLAGCINSTGNTTNTGDPICLDSGIVCPAGDGDFPVFGPLPNCSQFCMCSNGYPYLLNCTEGHHFNPTSYFCDAPELAGCKDSNTGDQICIDSGIVCPIEDEEFPLLGALPNCSQFCMCSNGYPYVHSCEGGHHFNPILQFCDAPDLAGCVNNTGNTNTGDQVCVDSGIVCPIENEGVPVLGALPNCSQFCICSNGYPYVHSCEGGHHFNPILQFCDAPDLAGCVNNTDNTNTGDQVCVDSGIVCPIENEGFPVLGALPNCSQFCLCSKGHPYVQSCKEGHHFNPVLQFCDASDLAGCTTGNSTSNGDQICIDSGIVCPIEDGEFPKFGALPNCSQFCMCASGYPYVHSCKEGHHFNPTLHFCDAPELAGCTNTTIPDKENDTNTGDQICIESGIICPVEVGKFPTFGALPDCSQFCLCSNGYPYLHNCPDNLHFDPILNICHAPEHAGCANITIPDNENNTSTGDQICLDAKIVCPIEDGDFPVFGALPNCSQFCLCSNGYPYLYNCSDTLHFNPTLNICDAPEHAGCSNTTIPDNDNNTNAGDQICIESGIICPVEVGEFPTFGALPDCSQFCLCSKGYPYLYNCSDNLHFDPVLNICHAPEHAGCANVTVPDNENNTNTGNQICLESGIICPTEEGEFPVFGSLPNCSQFCLCSNGYPYLYNCSDTLHFNPSLNICDAPEHAGCMNITNPDDDNSPNTGDQICLDSGLECPAEDGDTPVYGPLSNCSQFCMCSNGYPYIQNCKEGHHFNPTLHFCDAPELAGCMNITGNNTNGDQICLDTEIECPIEAGDFPVFGSLPNCSQFCLCSNGYPYLHNCPDNLHFDPILNVCHSPEHAGCANITVPDNENNTNTGDQTCLDSDIVCPIEEGDFPVFGASPNCSQFCLCSNSYPYLYSCPANLHFNPILNICDAPEHAGCMNIPDDDNNPNTGDQICLDSGLECPAEDGDTPVYGPLSNCSQFCMCSNGYPYIQNCKEGHHFNPILHFCDAPELAGCMNITGNNTNGDQICLDTEIECPIEEGDFPVFGSLPNCSQFCLCSNGYPYLHNCPDNLHFDPILKVCHSPERAGCANITEPDNENNTTTGDQACLDSDIVCPIEEGDFPVFGALPNCSQFCLCSNSYPYLYSCPANLHFNPTLNICDAPEHAGCMNISIPDNENNTNTGDQICIESEIVCPTKDGDYSVFGSLPNCAQFCLCSNGYPYLYNCPANLHFNPILNICDAPEHAGCANITVPDNENSTNTGDKICIDAEIVCSNEDGDFPVFGALPNCSQFCLCSNGYPYLHNCPDGLHFNTILNICHTPEHAGCANTTVPDNENNTNTGDQICIESNIVCPIEDGDFPVYGALPNCSQFCMCSNGYPYLRNCSDDLHFNPILDICDAPEHAGCANITVPDNDNSTNIGDQICIDAGIVCPIETGDFPTFGALANCSQFCLCSNGYPYLHNCPDNLHFDSILNICHAPEHAGCANITIPDNENNTSTGDQICLDAKIVCPIEDGDFPVFGALPNCSQFCLCSNGYPYLYHCSDTLHFNPILNICDAPEHAGCSNTTIPDNDNNTNTGDQICIESGIICPIEVGEFPTFGALPDCSQFCLCSNGYPYLHNCSDNLHFDSVLNICHAPEHAGCANITVPGNENDTNTGNQICLDSGIICPIEEGEFPVFGALPNCSQFCLCSNGYPYLYNCSDTLHFNPSLNICDAPEHAGCMNITNPDDDNSPNTGDQICLDSGLECPAEDGETPVYGPLLNCLQFCMCSNGYPYIQNCKEGHHFNPILHFCDAPELAGCMNITGNNTNGDQICLDTEIECPIEEDRFPVFGSLPNCSQFCLCSNGYPYLHNCPDNLHFDPILNICHSPEHAGCANITVPDNENNTNTGDQTCLDSDIVCPIEEGDFPVFGALPNCSQFCLCSNSYPYLYSCPANLHFNPTLNICDAPEHAGCMNIPDNENNTNTGDQVCIESGIICPVEVGEFPTFGPLPDCSQFCLCSNGYPYLHNCSDNLHFDPILNICHAPENAGCANVTVPDKENNTNTGDQICLDAKIVCPIEDGDFPVFGALPNCSQFCLCSNGYPYLYNCSDTLHFNPTLNICDAPEHAGCSNTTIPDNDNNTNTGDQICIESGIICPVEVGEFPTFGALPDCSQFCLCSNGYPYLHNCSDNLHFDPVLNICHAPDNAGCANVTVPDNENNTNTGNQICLESGIICPIEEDEFPVFGALPNCSQFCLCSNGYPYLYNCSDTLHFNPSLNICDAPEHAGCMNITNPDDDNSTNTGDQICLDSGLICPAEDGDTPVYGPLSNCSQFCMCSNGYPYIQNCKEGHHFNPILHFCDAPELAGCMNNTGNDTTNGDQICLESEIICPIVDEDFPVFGALPNCSQFCLCSNGYPYLHNCPDNLHFNPILNICHAQEHAGCANITAPDNENNTSTGDQICIDSQIVCPIEEGSFPVFGALPNCSQFCFCSNGYPYLHHCPDNLHFNQFLNICDAPEHAGCANITVPDNENSTNTGDQICLESGIECPIEDGDFPIFGALPNCSQFCMCSNGYPFLRNCPDTLHFNPTLNICDAPEHAGCVNITVPDTDNSTNIGDQICLDSEIVCPTEDGEFPTFGPLPSCSQFCLCSNGYPYLHNCPDNLHFNPILNICHAPEHAGCANVTIPDNENNTNIGDKICVDSGLVCPIEEGEFPVFGALPNCSQFCLCSNGYPYLYNCSDTLHFNPTLNICDAPEHAGCSNTTIPDNDNNTNTGDQICIESGIICPVEVGEFPTFGALPDCSQFCLCSNGYPYLHNCPDKMHFDPLLNICHAPENAGCMNITNPDNENNTNTGDQICHDAGIVCSIEDGGSPIYGALPNCSQFCLCSNGYPYLHNCSDNLHFNPSLSICDAPENAGCMNVTVPDDNNNTDTGDQVCLESGIVCPIDGELPVYGALPNCSQFCMCSNGIPHLAECIDGLHFNPILEFCDAPDLAGCMNNTENNTNTGDQVCLDSEIVCPIQDGEFPVYAALENCSQFCMCSNGYPYLHNCSGGLHFNPTLNVCDAPENAGCANITIPDNDNNTTTGDQICLDTGIVCPVEDGDFRVYGPLSNCSQFCMCSNGSPYVRNCTDNLHFNPTLNICDAPEHAGCMNITDPDNDNDTTTGDQICLESGIECPLEDTDFLVYGPLANCSQFCLCTGGYPYQRNCPEDLHFNPILNICDAPENAGCAKNDTDDDFKGDQICLDSGLECPAIDGDRSVYGPVDNCSQFCICREGKPYLFDCPEGLHFNRLYNTCDWPDKVGCETGNAACYNANIVCPVQDEEYPVFGSLPNCSEFCLCSKGTPFRFDCPKNLHFDPILNVCHWPENAGCPARNETHIPESHPLCVNENLECPVQVGGRPTYHAMPNCSQFCECSNGTLYLRNCSGNLQFNPVLNTCVWPDYSGCVEREPMRSCPVDLDCPTDGTVLFKSLQGDCSQYCQCSNGRAYLHQCPNGLHFSPGLNRCVWRDYSDCNAEENFFEDGQLVTKAIQSQSVGGNSGFTVTVSMMLVISLNVVAVFVK